MNRPVAVCVFLLLPSLGCSAPASEAQSSAVVVHDLRIDLRVSAPLEELSGVCVRHDLDGGRQELVVVGDDDRSVLIFDVDSGDGSLAEIEGDGRSDWEAVATDNSGRLFVAAEGAARIEVVDPVTRTVERTLSLSVPGGSEYDDWKQHKRSRAEGLVLLERGHVLVAKEKDAPALVELGPADDEPLGFDAEHVLADDFELGDDTLVALKRWDLREEDDSLLRDFSDAAVGPSGRLYLLSDESRAFVRVESVLGPDEDRIDVKEVYRLPEEMGKPEGLAFLGRKPVVVTDLRGDDGANLYFLDELP